MPKRNTSIEVQGTAIKIQAVGLHDYICLTDIAKSKNPQHPDDLIRNWLRNRNSLELLGIWEHLHNPDFNPVEFDGIRKQAGLNSFTLTPKQWIEKTAAIGLQSKAGRYGGTFAHKDIAFEFASWVSVEFKLYLIKDFQRLKDDENDRLQLEWNLQRTLSKINYRIHTDAIKDTLIPNAITSPTIAWSEALYATRPCTHRAARSPHQFRKPQFRLHPSRACSLRTPAKAQRYRHQPNAQPTRERWHQTPQIKLNLSR